MCGNIAMWIPVEAVMQFEQLGFAVQLAVAFGGGLIAFLSPCVLPMLPGYLGLMSGYSMADLRTGDASRSRMFRATSLFVLGFSLVFVAIGAAATQVASFLNRNREVTNITAGLLVIAFGIPMVGMAFSTRGIFGILQRDRRLEVRPSKLGSMAPPIMGVAFGFGWSPCIGTVLGGVLAIAATRDTVVQGMVLLLAFSLGLGVPFILSGLGLQRAFRTMGSIRRYVRPINVLSGGLMIAFGLLLATDNVFMLSQWVSKGFQAVPILEGLAQI